jgi:hypothetical protein
VNYNSNFLSANTPLFTAQGYAVLLVNAPSDQPKGERVEVIVEAPSSFSTSSSLRESG